MTVMYPAICHYEDGGYWSEFPDLEGCFSQGGTEQEVVENSRESLEGYVLSLLENGRELPRPTPIASIGVESGGFVSYISCDAAGAASHVRKNVTLPGWLCRKAEKAEINFSQVLQEALFRKLGVRP